MTDESIHKKYLYSMVLCMNNPPALGKSGRMFNIMNHLKIWEKLYFKDFNAQIDDEEFKKIMFELECDTERLEGRKPQ